MNNFIPISQPSITQLEIEYVTNAVKSGWVSSLGKYLEIFEERFADFVGTRYAVTVSNGTAALHLALVAHDIGPGDEVIIPDLTFIATANAVHYSGATVVCVDVEKDSLCIDPGKVAQAITEKTRAIIPVHIYGHPADMVSLQELARKHDLVIIEDAAEAHGAEVLGKRAGSLGNCGIFSFYGNKIITSGEGGMITTDDHSLYERLKVFRDHAMSKERRYWHDLVGFNYRMTNLQAALGVAQLERIDDLLERKRQIFHTYQRLLSGRPGLRLNQEASWAKNVYWMVCLEVVGFNGQRRDAFMERLKQRGIDSRPYFYPVSDMPMYADAITPVAHELSQRGINLPSYFDLDDALIEYICETIVAVLDEG